ncbi:hypothetical protein GCM10023094_09770 [Rhodococcus olei]|uniref:Uncharacterized protein n=1 Tax=Rhodococcus olei TaxID=2161675 RepID=A0ABP8NYW7_9NOCA
MAGLVAAGLLTTGVVHGVRAADSTAGPDWLLVMLWPVFAAFVLVAYLAWRALPGRPIRQGTLPTEIPAGLLPPRREATVTTDDLDDPTAIAMLHYNVRLTDLAEHERRRRR